MSTTPPDKYDFNTNSEIGSIHWFNTLMSNISRMGQYIGQESDNPLFSQYGDRIKEISNHLMDQYEKLKNPPQEVTLPSDEEIDTASLRGQNNNNTFFDHSNRSGFIEGAKWMRGLSEKEEKTEGG